MYEDYKHSDLTETIIRVFYEVYNVLGYGFSETVYENALAMQLSKAGLRVRQQSPLEVYFDGQLVGEYFADIIVNDCIMIEIKASKTLLPEHEAQLLNYLKASSIEVGLLLNFGPQPLIKRRAYDNDRKGSLTWLNPGLS